MDPSLLIAIWACATVSLTCWILSVLTSECSWVDRIWSIAPVGYAAWFTFSAPALDPRLLLMTALLALWGGRLTYNFYRKGGYGPGGEDYRWPIMRARMSPFAFQVFSFFFIAGFQNALLLLITLPVWVAQQHGPTPLATIDIVATALFLLLLAGETLSDEQMWAFQEDKRRKKEAGDAIERGFLNRGMYALSRHPNYFCEMGMFWVLCLFGIAAGASWLNFSLAGAAILTVLFQGSTNLAEEISLSKYPDYADYQRTTPRIVPWPRRG